MVLCWREGAVDSLNTQLVIPLVALGLSITLDSKRVFTAGSPDYNILERMEILFNSGYEAESQASQYLELIQMEPLHISDVEQPVFQETMVDILHGRPDSPAAVVSAHDDVSHLLFVSMRFISLHFCVTLN